MNELEFPLLVTGLTGRTLENFQQALSTFYAYEADTVITKTEFANLKYHVNIAIDYAWKALVKEAYAYNGRFRTLNDAERQLEQDNAFPACHVVVGYQKRAKAATKADGPMRDTMLLLLAEIVPLAERVNTLKAKIGKRAPARTKTAIAREQREGAAMTCQCCAHGILANTGVIAHHGYQRPAGWGYQTRSCEGARELPFEVSRDALGRHIANLHAYLLREQCFLRDVEAELLPLRWTFSDITTKQNAWTPGRDRTVSVTRENFQSVAEETREIRNEYGTTFDSLKKGVIGRSQGDIKMTQFAITQQQARYDAWTQTHERQGDEWVAV
jgi:hypothetical protein